MPHCHSYGLKWGFVFLKNTISHLLWKYWKCKPPHTPTNLPVAKTGVIGDIRDTTFPHTCGSWEIH